MLAFLIPESVSSSFIMSFPRMSATWSEAVVGLAEQVGLGHFRWPGSPVSGVTGGQ
jgi:hypothetical protein